MSDNFTDDKTNPTHFVFVVSEAAGRSGAFGLHKQIFGLQSGAVQPQWLCRLPVQVRTQLSIKTELWRINQDPYYDACVCNALVLVSSVKLRCFMRGCRAACLETTRTDMCPKPSPWSTAALRSGTEMTANS